MKKCRYYNDSKTCCALMIDDFSLTATTIDGAIYPWNDWGYGMHDKKSLFSFFEKNLLQVFPEIKGTFFVPLFRHAAQNVNSGYQILFKDFDHKTRAFFDSIKSSWEIQFHGLTHGKFVDSQNPSFQNWVHEFTYLTQKDIDPIRAAIRSIEDMLGIEISGGKYPGYCKNEHSEDIIEQLDFKWWCSTAEMISKKHRLNKHKYFGNRKNILDIPTNLSGDIFQPRLFPDQSLTFLIKNLKKKLGDFRREQFIGYLYENRLPITIQEHFQTLRTDGKRQPINVYDDIVSLQKILSLLKGADIWYATCSELAHYLESFDFTELIEYSDNIFEIKYNGRWDAPFLTLGGNSRCLLNLQTGETVQGVYKQGIWIFNDLSIGRYQEQ